ncbi:unnamed protein product, partial [Ceratitis capitata]
DTKQLLRPESAPTTRQRLQQQQHEQLELKATNTTTRGYNFNFQLWQQHRQTANSRQSRLTKATTT